MKSKYLSEISIENEIDIDDDAVLISKTDIKGNILYISPDFLNLTGYTEKEIFQQNHNFIKHPDMPAEVFKEMWSTITQGLSWTGILKNRTRSGQGYWLDTTITPIFSHKEIQGFISVRRKVSKESVSKYIEHLDYLQSRKDNRGIVKLISDIHHKITNISKIQSFLFLGLFIFLGFTPFFDLSFQYVWLFSCTTIACVANILIIENYIHRKIKLVNAYSGSVSGGNFRPEGYNLPKITTEDPFLNSIIGFKTIVIQFSGILHKLSVNIKSQFITYDQLTEASKKIDSFIRSISHSTKDHSENIQNLSQMIQKISKSIDIQSNNTLHISENVNEISDIMVVTAQYLEEMTVIIEKTMQRYESSKDHVNSLMGDMEEMKSLSENMGSVITVIDEISEKINLLSVNAAIESARAGELGKGFAVVAREVSSLSEKTAENVKSIASTIHSFRKSINDGTIKTRGVVHIFQEIQDLILSLHEVTEKVQESSLNQLEKIMDINGNVSEAKGELENINQSVQVERDRLIDFSASIGKLNEEANTSVNLGDQIRNLSRKAYVSHKEISEILNHFKS
jgi:aerotaxis receptor